MRRSTLMYACIAFVLCTVPSPAQDTDSLSLEGRKGLVFSFNGFNLYGGLGGKYWMSDNWDLRVVLTGSYDRSKDLTDGSTSVSSRVGLTGYFDRHFEIAHALSPYVGLGAGLGYSYYSNPSYYAEPSRYLLVELPLLVGVEYWLTPNISFSGEQNVSFRFHVSQTARDYRVENSTSTLLLTLYF